MPATAGKNYIKHPKTALAENSKKIGMVGFNIGYAVLLSLLGISIAPMQL